ncbi:MAG TPA: toxic anion resistance protein, partial [Rubrivivax sp.]|nr:toxic anion resistance protein [Rubrivivax sp.]
TIDLAQLQKAFANIYQAMDTVADFKVKALASMQTTVDTLSTEIDKSRKYVDRVRQAEAAEAVNAAPQASNTGVVL